MCIVCLWVLVETKQQSVRLGTQCSSWFCCCCLYKAKGGSEHITFPFPHLCLCALMYVHMCVFGLGGGRTESFVREFPPPNAKVMTSSVQWGSLHFVFYISSVRSEGLGNKQEELGGEGATRAIKEISWQGQTLSHWEKHCFVWNDNGHEDNEENHDDSSDENHFWVICTHTFNILLTFYFMCLYILFFHKENKL